MLGEVVLINIERVLFGNLVQYDLGFEGLSSPLLKVGPELLLGLILGNIGKVLLKGQSGLNELLGNLLTATIEFGVEQVLRQFNLDLADQCLQDRVACLTRLLQPGHPRKAVLDVGAKLLDRV